MKEIVTSSMAPEPIGPYSQGVASSGFVFLSGQVGRKHDAEMNGVYAEFFD